MLDIAPWFEVASSPIERLAVAGENIAETAGLINAASIARVPALPKEPRLIFSTTPPHAGKTRGRLEEMRKLWNSAGPPGQARARVIIYSRPGCHLCDEAKASMASAGCDDDFTLEEVNIDEDPELKGLYQYDIPVVLINGIKAFKHRVDPKEFKRKLRRIAG